MEENELAKQIVDAAYQIHKKLGPGLLESLYATILAYELDQRGLTVQSQHPMPLTYNGIRFETAFRADLLINNKVIVEIKSVEAIAPIHQKQLLTYLKLTDLRLGLLINFNVLLIKDGITRIANRL